MDIWEFISNFSQSQECDQYLANLAYLAQKIDAMLVNARMDPSTRGEYGAAIMMFILQEGKDAGGSQGRYSGRPPAGRQGGSGMTGGYPG